MSMYRTLYRHLLTRLDAERTHDLSLRALRLAGSIAPMRLALQRAFTPDVHGMAVRALGYRFAHPIGLAAGYDKDGICVPGLSALGFSFIEIGTVTPRPQAGNPGKRLFRLVEDGALINRMGFPSAGMLSVAQNLTRLGEHPCPIGISLGKNKDTPLVIAHEDYVTTLQWLYAYGDFFVVNVSSPNTPDLRKLQTRDYLANIMARLRQVADTLSESQKLLRAKPLLVKIAPDMSWDEIDTVIELATEYHFDGIVATNTTTQRDGLRSRYAVETGGLSGPPLKARSTEIIRYIARQTHGALCIIGVGGIFAPSDVEEKLEAGATLVQAYTGLVYQGPGFVKNLLAPP